jgi:hypothetical protein
VEGAGGSAGTLAAGRARCAPVTWARCFGAGWAGLESAAGLGSTVTGARCAIGCGAGARPPPVTARMAITPPAITTRPARSVTPVLNRISSSQAYKAARTAAGPA